MCPAHSRSWGTEESQVRPSPSRSSQHSREDPQQRPLPVSAAAQANGSLYPQTVLPTWAHPSSSKQTLPLPFTVPQKLGHSALSLLPHHILGLPYLPRPLHPLLPKREPYRQGLCPQAWQGYGVQTVLRFQRPGADTRGKRGMSSCLLCIRQYPVARLGLSYSGNL